MEGIVNGAQYRGRYKRTCFGLQKSIRKAGEKLYLSAGQWSQTQSLSKVGGKGFTHRQHPTNLRNQEQVQQCCWTRMPGAQLICVEFFHTKLGKLCLL